MPSKKELLYNANQIGKFLWLVTLLSAVIVVIPVAVVTLIVNITFMPSILSFFASVLFLCVYYITWTFWCSEVR